MPQGSVFFTIRTAEDAVPLSGEVSLFTPDGNFLGQDTVQAENGSVSREFFLDAPERSLSLSPQDIQPYSTYNARITADGFQPVEILGIQIFADEKSFVPVEMIPASGRTGEVVRYEIGPHSLRTVRTGEPEAPTGNERVLSEVFIPARITVHLGVPNSFASNVTVPFVDYIKNVASSEVYPTWPERSLRANILCQISLALNRIFTEWYPSRGYSFNITNSTAYDQYYVYGRNIYESISVIVDEIFNNYIRRPDRIEPYFAEYCNGSTVTCAGLSQWGTVSLAEQGYSVEEILQFYYGDVEIVQTNNIREIESSYPGSPLSVGSNGAAVRTLQQQLNRIRINYPAIPAIVNVDGIFGPQTREAVLAFQRIFDLTPDGVVGKSTWYRISYIYVAVKKLAELNSEGERPQYDNNTYPGLIRFGDTGSDVQKLQLYLKTIAAYNPFLPDLAIDGFFGRSTQNAVRSFQEYYGLTPDGIVGENTWNRIVNVFLDITEGGDLILEPYPGTILQQGSRGDSVRYVQQLLNRIRRVFVTIPSLTEDGVFGARTRLAVREFQRLFGLGTDGIVGQRTWNALNRVYSAVVSGCLENSATESGRLLRFGSSGSDVSRIQQQLRLIHTSLNAVPDVAVDANYGRNTERSIRTFQEITGLRADGIVGNTTRTRLSAFARAVSNNCLPTSSARTLSFFPGEEQSTLSMPSMTPRNWVSMATMPGMTPQNTMPMPEREVRTSRWPKDCLWADMEEWDKK